MECVDWCMFDVPQSGGYQLVSPEEFEHKLMETDAYLQLLIEQNEVRRQRRILEVSVEPAVLLF